MGGSEGAGEGWPELLTFTAALTANASHDGVPLHHVMLATEPTNGEIKDFLLIFK